MGRKEAIEGREIESGGPSVGVGSGKASPLRISYIGHATLLIEMAGVRVLTDPNFDVRLGGVLKRVAAPIPSLDALSLPDAVLVSHAHADHLSRESLESLESLAAMAREAGVPLYSPPAVTRWVQKRGYSDARPVSPGDEIRLEAPVVSAGAGATIHVGAAAHEGSRYGFDRWAGRGSSNTYLIDSGSESVFFAGDTGLRADSHAMVARKLAPAGRRLDVALLPIGYSPWWRPGFRRHHLSPADALLLFDRLDARVLIPYHWGTFHHFSSGPFDAVRQLQELLVRYPRRTDVRMVPPGSTLVINTIPGLDERATQASPLPQTP